MQLRIIGQAQHLQLQQIGDLPRTVECHPLWALELIEQAGEALVAVANTHSQNLLQVAGDFFEVFGADRMIGKEPA